jgi:hypothetical protein
MFSFLEIPEILKIVPISNLKIWIDLVSGEA